ncbi:MAG: hypothetical protein HYR67_11855, partial [Bacteroidetes bacterium]|nr:hypothetical protein [Bacteroidota bacterium]
MRNSVLGFLALISSMSMSVAQQNPQQLQQSLEMARKETDRLRYIMIANEISIRSQELNNKELAALLAVQAYNYNSKNRGYDYNSNAYGGLASALKQFDSLPIKQNGDSKLTALRSSVKTDSVRKGKDLIVADDSGDVIIVRNGIIRKRLSGHHTQVEHIGISPFGKFMVTLSKDMTLCIWNLSDLTKHPLVIKENTSIEGVLFSSDETQVLVSVKNQEFPIHVWPLTMDIMAKRLCSCLKRNMTLEQWEQYVGDVPYEAT